MTGAFLIGLIGSMHCVGMCGPLMITFSSKSGKYPGVSFVLYHLGRLLVYTTIGLIFGVISSSIFFFQFQQYGSIVFGLLIIIVYLFPKWRNKLEGIYYHSMLYAFFKKKLTGFYSGKAKWFAAGLLNGLLPCGLIYLAAAGATLSGTMVDSILFMIAFGLGTIPALFTLTYLSKKLPMLISKMSYIVTPVALISGGLLIYRGLTVQNPDMNQLIQSHIMNAISVCGF